MRTLQLGIGFAAFLLANVASAGNVIRAGLDLPLGSLGLLGVTAVGLIVSIGIARRKR